MLALILLLLVFAELACCIWSMARLKSYVNLMDRVAKAQDDLRARVAKMEGLDVVAVDEIDAPAESAMDSGEGAIPQIDIDDEKREELLAGLSDLPDTATPEERAQAAMLLKMLGM